MEAAGVPLLAALAAASSVAADIDAPHTEGDEAPPSVRITRASLLTWSTMFHRHIVDAAPVGDGDDLLFFVRAPGHHDEPFYALRRDSKQVPERESPDVNWEESYYLNLIMHSMEYAIEVSVRQRKWSAAENKMVSTSLKKLTKKVWAAPNHARLDGGSKAESVELTYPYIYFRVDDYEEIWREIQLEKPDQIIAVELFATGPLPQQLRHKLFSGALSYEAISQAVKERGSAFSLSGPPAQHFFKLRGPRGKGSAQLCVKRAVGSEGAGGLGAWALSLLRVNDSDASGPFVCSITWLSVSWLSIIRDLLRGCCAAVPPKKDVAS